jgi:1,4-dihydroxy-2-naphthoate octaprenyltransferase
VKAYVSVYSDKLCLIDNILCLLNIWLLLLLLLLPQVVKAYVSVYSDEVGKERAINNLKRIAP